MNDEIKKWGYIVKLNITDYEEIDKAEIEKYISRAKIVKKSEKN